MPVDSIDNTGNLLVRHGRHWHMHTKTIILNSYPSSANLYPVVGYNAARRQLAAEGQHDID
jgi:hypothetical protein